MSGKGKTQSRKAPADYGGLDPMLMQSIVSKIPPNRTTGRVEMTDIMKFMSENPEQMDALLKHTEHLPGLADDDNLDLSKHDFAALAGTIVHESFWVLQLENDGVVDLEGRSVDPDTQPKSAVLRPAFTIWCYDDHGSYRIMKNSIGLPSSEIVLQTLRRAIAVPIPPLKPCLPWFLLISIKLKQHVPMLKPFLDSLPAPFHWRVETPEEAETLNENIHVRNEHGVKEGIELAASCKTSGNSAFSKKDRAGALKAYSEAIDHLIDALSQKPDVDDAKHAKAQLAVCYANRAAAYLISGEGLDAKKALRDGKSSENANPDYAKAYVRQATAHRLLDESDEARDIIALALRRPALEDDKGLVDCFIGLITDGKGLSDDEAIFKNWVLDLKINDRRSADRVRGLKGEWQRRMDAQFAKWKR